MTDVQYWRPVPAPKYAHGPFNTGWAATVYLKRNEWGASYHFFVTADSEADARDKALALFKGNIKSSIEISSVYVSKVEINPFYFEKPDGSKVSSGEIVFISEP